MLRSDYATLRNRTLCLRKSTQVYAEVREMGTRNRLKKLNMFNFLAYSLRRARERKSTQVYATVRHSYATVRHPYATVRKNALLLRTVAYRPA